MPWWEFQHFLEACWIHLSSLILRLWISLTALSPSLCTWHPDLPTRASVLPLLADLLQQARSSPHLCCHWSLKAVPEVWGTPQLPESGLYMGERGVLLFFPPCSSPLPIPSSQDSTPNSHTHPKFPRNEGQREGHFGLLNWLQHKWNTLSLHSFGFNRISWYLIFKFS